MRLANLALPLFVLAATGAGVAALNFSPSPQTKTFTPVESSNPPKTVSPAKPTETLSARDVGGSSVTKPVLPDAPLERIAPLPVQKPLEVFGPPMLPLSKDEPFLLFQPVVENAGTLVAEGRRIRLLNLEPVDASQTCTNANGVQWPCGRQARTAFRAFVRGRAISCLLPEQQKTAVETECNIGKENLGEWLVEQGWAGAKPNSDLESLGQAAEHMGRGIYGKGS